MIWGIFATFAGIFLEIYFLSNGMRTQTKLILLYLLQYAMWGTYLTSQGRYLNVMGLGEHIGAFFVVPGLAAVLMPTLVGILADRFIEAQRLLRICHVLASLFFLSAGIYGVVAGESVRFAGLFPLYVMAVVFYMPTTSLANSVTFMVLAQEKMDASRHFPVIRLWGTAGFIVGMCATDLLGIQSDAGQYVLTGMTGLMLALYTCLLPHCPTASTASVAASAEEKPEKGSFLNRVGFGAFGLFRKPDLALILATAALMGCALQVSNSFCGAYLADFGHLERYENSFGVVHGNMLMSLAQASELLFMLLLPWVYRRLGIVRTFLLSMLAWALRYLLLAFGNPGGGVWMLILSMLVYGAAFCCFNIAGSMYVNERADASVRASAQGLFVLMTSGLGASVGVPLAQAAVNRLVNLPREAGAPWETVLAGWQHSWMVFAAYVLLVALLFLVFSRSCSVRDAWKRR